MEKFDFSGWATKANIRCSDGRTIMPDAFKHMDGAKVPLIWNHEHQKVHDVLGYAILEHRDGEGVYAYGSFNDTESGQAAKKVVQHGDVVALSIYADQLQQNDRKHVIHGMIREVSLVLAGANPGASIDSLVVAHGDDVEVFEDEGYIYHGDEGISVTEPETEEDLTHADDKKEEEKAADTKTEEPKEKTVQDVIDTMNEEQQDVLYGLLAKAAKQAKAQTETKKDDESEGGKDTMKHNVFDTKETKQGNFLSHAEQMDIIATAKLPGVGSLQQAIAMFNEERQSTLAHADGEEATGDGVGIFEDFGSLLPEYELLKKGEPETLERDQSWIDVVLRKIHKSPISRIRTRQADARIAELRAKGYQNKGDEKKAMEQIKLIGRTTDPQTIYIKSDMHRDDIIDITDFDVVAYQWKMMRHILNEELAMAALVGDRREDGDPDKIHESHVRSIWNDEELYTIHADVDIEAAREELQGTNTGANFGENYIYAEAIITAALYAREKFKGSGTPDLYCTPHLLNVMLLARDLNGRRIYDSKADLAAALNVAAIYTVEQFEGLTRTDKDGNEKKLLGLFVNLADYQFGCTKGGEISRFEDFDMDFNKYKYMLETRLSGSLTRLFAAIALEEPVVTGAEG